MTDEQANYTVESMKRDAQKKLRPDAAPPETLCGAWVSASRVGKWPRCKLERGHTGKCSAAPTPPCKICSHHHFPTDPCIFVGVKRPDAAPPNPMNRKPAWVGSHKDDRSRNSPAYGPDGRVDPPETMSERPDAAPPEKGCTCPPLLKDGDRACDWCVQQATQHLALTDKVVALMNKPPWQLRPLTDLADDGGDYIDFSTLLHDLRMDAKEHPATVNRYEWYHEQIGKLLRRIVVHPEDAPGGPGWEGLARMMYDSLSNTHRACFFCGRGVGHESDCQWNAVDRLKGEGEKDG